MHVACEMAFDNFVSERQVLLVRSPGVRPAPSHRGTPTSLAGPVVLPSRVHVLAENNARNNRTFAARGEVPSTSGGRASSGRAPSKSCGDHAASAVSPPRSSRPSKPRSREFSAHCGQLGLQLVNGRGLADLQMMLAPLDETSHPERRRSLRGLAPGGRSVHREVYGGLPNPYPLRVYADSVPLTCGKVRPLGFEPRTCGFIISRVRKVGVEESNAHHVGHRRGSDHKMFLWSLRN